MNCIGSRTKCALALAVAGMLAIGPAMAEKPSWAGGGKPERSERSDKRDNQKDDRDDHNDQFLSNHVITFFDVRSGPSSPLLLFLPVGRHSPLTGQAW